MTRHVALDGKRRQEPLDLLLAHFCRVPLAVEENEAPDPTNVGLLGAVAVVPAVRDRATSVDSFRSIPSS
jgi:hypothetical protein